MEEASKRPTVKKWHPWQDKPGQRHSLALWDNQGIKQPDIFRYFFPGSAEDIVQYVGKNRLYVLCRDILAYDFPHGDDLLRHEKSQTYLQKHGKIVAVRVRSGRYSGFMIPSRTWNHALPGPELLEDMRELFSLFKFEGITPASVSEKILRSTLPEHHTIYRPSVFVRNALLEHNGGGRIDESEESLLFPVVYTYDIKSAYLYYSRSVPTPFKPPYDHSLPDLHWILDFPCGFWKVEMIAHGSGVHPIYLEDRENGNQCGKRFPYEGERFVKWLWSGTIRDCIEKGYTLIHCERGWRWEELSDFMAPWSDILYDGYQSVDVSHETLRSIIKSMWVSLPGRFLKQPFQYNLIDQQHVQKGDIPISTNWFHFHSNWEGIDVQSPPKFLTKWYVRAEYDKESTALTPIGAYIVEECRRAVYRLQVEEESRGNTALASYIDSVSFARRIAILDRIGVRPGDLKEEISEQGWLEMNRFVRAVDGQVEMRAPGVSGKHESEKRILLLKKYRQICDRQKTDLTKI